MDLDVYKMDPNPYNKDNETNWVNWNELKQNEDLVRFYKKLIKIRKENASLRNKDYRILEFIEFENRYFLGYKVDETMIAFINGDNKNHFTATLPNGSWKLLISTDKIVNDMIYEGELIIEPTSGILLRKI